MLTETEAPAFELFASVFFIFEVSIRMYAHTPYRFFCGYSGKIIELDRWINCCDFTLSVLDVFGMMVEYVLAGNEGLANVAKTGRATRMIKLIKFVRMLRMWRVVRMFIMVFARERDETIMNRRKNVANKIASLSTTWRIDRKTFSFVSDEHDDPFFKQDRQVDQQLYICAVPQVRVSAVLVVLCTCAPPSSLRSPHHSSPLPLLRFWHQGALSEAKAGIVFARCRQDTEEGPPPHFGRGPPNG
jgi:hypothetical protein